MKEATTTTEEHTMATITHITSNDINDLTTLYIDGKQGTVLDIGWNDSTEMTIVTYEDANGEHTLALEPGATVPALIG